jgi:hypothetical protein
MRVNACRKLNRGGKAKGSVAAPKSPPQRQQGRGGRDPSAEGTSGHEADALAGVRGRVLGFATTGFARAGACGAARQGVLANASFGLRGGITPQREG